jgi:hypothetical protein
MQGKICSPTNSQLFGAAALNDLRCSKESWFAPIIYIDKFKTSVTLKPIMWQGLREIARTEASPFTM